MPLYNLSLMDNIMNNQEELKTLIRQGKEIGYILNETLDKCLLSFSAIDRKYIIETLEEMEIQIVDSPKEYDEYKYLSGEEAIKILQQISDMGIKLAIDDFGTGYSSLSYLKKLPINKKIKISSTK